MQFSTKTILALSLMSTTDVNGHGRLTKPGAPENGRLTTPGVSQLVTYGDHWYNQGTLNYMMIHNYTCKFLFQGSYYLFFYYFFFNNQNKMT